MHPSTFARRHVHEGRCVPFGRKVTRPAAPRTKQPRDLIAARQGNKCDICKGPLYVYDIDHRVPWACEGSEEIVNMRALCTNCHAWTTRSDARWLALCRRVEPVIRLEQTDDIPVLGDEGDETKKEDGDSDRKSVMSLFLCLDCKQVFCGIVPHQCPGYSDGMLKYPALLAHIERLEAKRARYNRKVAKKGDAPWSSVVNEVDWNTGLDDEEDDAVDHGIKASTFLETFAYRGPTKKRRQSETVTAETERKEEFTILHTNTDIRDVFRLEGPLPVHVYAGIPLCIRDGAWPHLLAQVRDNGRLGLPGGRAGKFDSAPGIPVLEKAMDKELIEEHNLSFHKIRAALASSGGEERIMYGLVSQKGNGWSSRHIVVCWTWRFGKGAGPPASLSLSTIMKHGSEASNLGTEVIGVCAVPCCDPPGSVAHFRRRAMRNMGRHLWEFPHLELIKM